MGVGQRNPQQAVGRWNNARAAHGVAVAVQSVVHEPGFIFGQHHVPAKALGAIADVVPLPIGVGLQCVLHRIPVVAPHRGEAHHVHRVAPGTQTRHRRLGQSHIGCHSLQGVSVQHPDMGCGFLRQVFGHDQTVVQNHEGVVRLFHGQTGLCQRLAMSIQAVYEAAVHDIQKSISMQRHATRPHRSTRQPR